MKYNVRSKHEFAVFIDTSGFESATLLRINNEKLLHRFSRVLRLKEGDTCILFDAQYAWQSKLVTLTTDEALFEVLHKQPHQVVTPTVAWALPLLESADLERAVYALAAMGVTTIQPLITRKSRHDGLKSKELQRLERIMIAACEQSKQFVLPRMLEERDFGTWIQQQTGIDNFLFFDAQGIACFDILEKMRSHRVASLLCLVGPEGDLTIEEKQQAQQYATFVKLTPSVLRACDAVMVGMGIVRSCLLLAL